MRHLIPSSPDSQRLAFCLFLALVVHTLGIFGVGSSARMLVPPEDIAVVWREGGETPRQSASAGERAPWPAAVHARPGTEEEHRVRTLEQEYVQQWVARTERMGSTMARGLGGEVVVHVEMDARGKVRGVDVEPGSTRLARMARRIVFQSQPHAPFPEALRMHRERLVISRRWLFGDAGELSVEARRP